MKKLGFILIIIGVLSFIGASAKGHSVFGPIFWIGVGGTILYLKREKEENSSEELPEVDKETDHVNDDIEEIDAEYSEVEVSEQDNSLSHEQKEAALCLIAFFAGYNDDIMSNDTAYMVASQSATFYGIDNYRDTLTKAMAKFNDPDKLIDTVLTIHDEKAKEFLLLSCYDLTKMSGKDEAYELLYNIANDMGYNKDKLHKLINQYSQKQQL